MRTAGKLGLFEYAIYIPFYPKSGYKVLNHYETLTRVKLYDIIIIVVDLKQIRGLGGTEAGGLPN